MKYIDIGETLQLAEAVTGIRASVLRFTSNIENLESALYAPKIGFESLDIYQDFEMKASVLTTRIVLNHAILDGNKRLAFAALDVFCDINGFVLEAELPQVIALFVLIASGEATENELADWIGMRLAPASALID